MNINNLYLEDEGLISEVAHNCATEGTREVKKLNALAKRKKRKRKCTLEKKWSGNNRDDSETKAKQKTLEDSKSPNKRKTNNGCLKPISKLLENDTDLHWSSNSYIMHNITSCILDNDWTTMAHLLHVLSEQNNTSINFNAYLWKTCFYNLVINPSDEYGTLLQEFLNQCFSQPKAIGRFDIKYGISEDVSN